MRRSISFITSVRVSGESMEPDYHDGDEVLVRRCSDLRQGDVYIWSVPGMGLMIKEAGPDRLISRNEDYADIVPWEEDGALMIGRVLGVLSPDMIPSAEEQNLYREAMEQQKDS